MANTISHEQPQGDTNSEPPPPLVFIYTGKPAPRYVRWNLRLARKNYPGEIYFLTDHPTPLRHATVVDIRPWYQKEPFQRFCEASPLDPFFREGFWLKAAERFFVLAQFMRESNLNRAFHIESDVLVLNVDGFATQLDSFGQGIFAPPETPTQAVASLMYVNDVQSLEKLCDYTISHAHLGNEMKILGHFMAENPSIAHALPCNHVLDSSWPLMPSTVPPEVGLVDATFLGMWVWGIDPRNSESSMWNHRVPGLTTHPTKTLRMSPGLPGKPMWMGLRGGTRHQLRTLHVHSKVFFRLNIPGALATYLMLSNLPWRTMIVPKWSMVFHVIPHSFLTPRLGTLLVSLPGPARSMAARLIVWSAERSPRQLSIRQRTLLNQLLPRGKALTASDSHEVVLRWDGNHKGELSGVIDSLTHYPRISVISPATKFSSGPEGYPGGILLPERLLENFLPPDTLEALCQRPEVALELATIAYLHQSHHKQLVLVSAGKGARSVPLPLSHLTRLPLVFSPHKAVEAGNLADAFWSPSAVETSWAYDEKGQLIAPAIIREMFPDLSTSLQRLSELALAPGARELSLIQLYGSWVRRHHRSESKLLQSSP